MSCLLTAGLNAQECRDTVGGVISFYITNYANVESIDKAVDGSVTGITMTTGTTFYTFTPNKNTSTWGQTIQGTPESGTLGFEHTATMVFSKNEQADINTVKLLGMSNTMVIVKERSGRYYLLGEFEGMELTEGNFASGTVLADTNGWTLTFASSNRNPAPEVDSSIIAGLI